MIQLYQAQTPEELFGHIFGDAAGYLVSFTAQQARFTRPDARHNELTDIRHRFWKYPAAAAHAAEYLLAESEKRRDAYVATHLFRRPGRRLAAYTAPVVSALWLDEDEGELPPTAPTPTAIVASSADRRHLYWKLAHPIAVEAAVDLNRRLAVWANGDVGKSALATVLRAPGTMNYKRFPQVDPVTIEFNAGVPAWDPEVLDQAIPVGTPTATSEVGSYDGPDLDITDYLDGVEVLGEVADGLGRKFAIACPWVCEHSGGDRSGTYCGQRAGGGMWFCCRHEHCAGRGWREFAQKVGRPRRIRLETPRPGDELRRVVINLD